MKASDLLLFNGGCLQAAHEMVSLVESCDDNLKAEIVSQVERIYIISYGSDMGCLDQVLPCIVPLVIVKQRDEDGHCKLDAEAGTLTLTLIAYLTPSD